MGGKKLLFWFQICGTGLAGGVVQTHCPSNAPVSLQSEASSGQVFDSFYFCVWAGKEKRKTSSAKGGSPDTCCFLYLSFLQKDAFCSCAGGLSRACVLLAPLAGLSV